MFSSNESLLSEDRTFSKDNGKRSEHLYRLFRPEFVRQYEHALCGDVFCNFAVENREKFEKDLHQATLILEQQTIPDFLRMFLIDQTQRLYTLGHSLLDVNQSRATLTAAFDRLCVVMHHKGINIRYLGFLRRLLPPSYSNLRKFLLTEIVARVSVKNRS